MRKLYIILMFAGLYFPHPQAYGQLLNKMKQKLENQAGKAVDKALNGGNKTTATPPGSSRAATGNLTFPTGNPSATSARGSRLPEARQ
jgi:hypothetical protein